MRCPVWFEIQTTTRGFSIFGNHPFKNNKIFYKVRVEKARTVSRNMSRAFVPDALSEFMLTKTKVTEVYGYNGTISQRKHGCNVQAILENMYEEQREHTFAAFGETYLKYRRVVLEWMVGVCEYFSLHMTTTYAAAAYLDRLQPNEKFSRFEWQMVAICCILISAKYNESEEDVPDLTTLEEITQQKISNETVLSYELWALKKMGWKLTVHTPMAFLSSYAACGIFFAGDECEDYPELLSAHMKSNNLDIQERRLQSINNDAVAVPTYEPIFEELATKHMLTLSSLCLLDSKYKEFHASMVAAAILYCCRRDLRISPIWPKDLVELTAYEFHEIYHIISQISYCASQIGVLSDEECRDGQFECDSELYIEGVVEQRTSNLESIQSDNDDSIDAFDYQSREKGYHIGLVSIERSSASTYGARSSVCSFDEMNLENSTPGCRTSPTSIIDIDSGSYLIFHP